MKLLVICNPGAQSGRAENYLPAIRDAFAEFSMDAELVLTNAAGHASRLAGDSAASGYSGVVACGGDGTVFEVVNGLMAQEAALRLPMGLIPMGTGNAFAREFELTPANWKDAIRLMATGKRRKIDVGKAVTGDDVFYFLNIIGIGFAVDAGLAARKLKFFGNTAYTLGTLKETLRLSSYPLEMKLDGESLAQENVFVEISNSRYTGTKFLIAPQARIDDGLLDVTLLRKVSRLRLLRLFPTIYSGRHIEFKEVDTMQARRILIEVPSGKLMTVDGEFRGHTPVDIQCMPGELELLL